MNYRKKIARIIFKVRKTIKRSSFLIKFKGSKELDEIKNFFEGEGNIFKAAEIKVSLLKR